MWQISLEQIEATVSEFLRPGRVKIGSRNFGRDRRYPISNFFHTGPKAKAAR